MCKYQKEINILKMHDQSKSAKKAPEALPAKNIFVVSIPYLSAFVFSVVRASFTSFNAVRNVLMVLSLLRSALMFEHFGIQTLYPKSITKC